MSNNFSNEIAMQEVAYLQNYASGTQHNLKNVLDFLRKNEISFPIGEQLKSDIYFIYMKSTYLWIQPN